MSKSEVPAPAPTPKFPLVSEEFMAALKALPIPEMFPFNTCTGEQALKQWGFAQGVLFVKAMIKQSNDAARKSNTDMTVQFKQ